MWKIACQRYCNLRRLLRFNQICLQHALAVLFSGEMQQLCWSSLTLFLDLSPTQVRMPFFILHGEADTVTDPEVSRALYERAASTDKTIKLYPGMWHGLTAGEPDENVELVFFDIVSWLDKRSRHWEDGERVRTPPEHENKQRQVPANGRTQRSGSFLCGLGGRPHQQQCRM